MSDDNGFGGIAFTDLWTAEGQKICLTARADDVQQALDKLMTVVKEAQNSPHILFPLRPAQNGKPASKAPQPKQAAPPPDSFPFQEGEDFIEPEPTGMQEVSMGHDWGLVDRKPKASDTKFGDRYEIQVDEYKREPDGISFYVSGLKFPLLQHNMKSEYAQGLFDKIFKGWQPNVVDEHKPMPGGPIILQVQCTGPDKQTSAGNPYHNLTGVRRP